ncbi:hypothetical protein H0H93_007032 [Arthromyces matolae]|nr:hypothetical protein H0H93_007032 [Arthromyces matolae]
MVTPERPPTDSLIYANIVISVLSPLVIDSVLLFRLLAFYPVLTTARITFLKVLAFPILVKCGRLASVTLFLHQMNQTSGQNSIGVLAEKLWFRNHYMISEWSLQMADNLYSTSLLLWKLRKFYRGGDQGFRLQSTLSETLVSRLRGIFVIALANFVFPLFVNVTQLVLIIQDTDYAHGTEVLFGNFYISIIGILFATVWASRHAWGHNDRDRDEDLSTFQTSTMPGYVMSNASAHARVSDRHRGRGPQLNLASQQDRSRSDQSSQDGFKA